jgi:hypothetical protein
MTTTIARDDIHAFAAAVRAHLDDLPADDVDELLDGLEADMTEQAAEAGDEFVLPDAASYAAELRAAAGLPDRETPHARGGWRAVVHRLNEVDRRAAAALRANPAMRWMWDLLRSLRPAWWVLRGCIWGLLLVPLLGITVNRRGDLLDHLLMLSHPAAWLFMFAVVLLSVQWGRGKWVPTRWLRAVRSIVNVVTAVIAPFVVMSAVLTVSSVLASSGVEEGVSWQPGLAVDGQRVRNIFAYDADGNPITSVQLFDQDGRPLTTVGGGAPNDLDWYFYGGGGPTPVALQIPGRQPVWNVFPLRELSPDAWPDGDPMKDALRPGVPFAQVPPLPLSASDPDAALTPNGGASVESPVTPPPTPTSVPTP